MNSTKLLPGTLLMLALTTSSLAYAQESADTPPGAPPAATQQAGGQNAKGWQHHNELLELLSDDKRKILHDAMEKNHQDNKAMWEQGKKLHEERDALLKAPKFDQDAFLKKSAEIDALHDKMAQSREKTIASVASQFSPEERRVLLVMGHMKHHHGHGGEWGNNRHGPHDPASGQEDTHQSS